MKRAIAKGAVQFAFGRLPGGSHLYRTLTRRFMGTQSTHVDKLARVWPGYVKVWQELCGLELEGKRIWIHEGGYTIFPFLVGYLVTGLGPVVTNVEATLLDQYVGKSVDAALAFDVGDSEPARERLEHLQDLASSPKSALEWVESVGGTYYEDERPEALSLDSNSVDLVHSGGALEHYKVPRLREFVHQSAEKLRPGGVVSHIFDHRDHLYHADKQMPFLNHLRFSETAYRILFGHHLTYHNRLNSDEIRALFTEAGLEEILLRRHILPDARYVNSDAEAIEDGMLGLSKSCVHKRFGHSEADLHTAAGHYLFRKAGASSA